MTYCPPASCTMYTFRDLIADALPQKKPYSAVTVAVENLTSEHYEEDDFSGIPDLVEAIKLQVRKPLYG